MKFPAWFPPILLWLLGSITACTPVVPMALHREVHSSTLPVGVLWQTNLGPGEGIVEAPLVTQEVVVLATRHALYGLDPISGTQYWTRRIAAAKHGSPMEASGSLVVFGDDTGSIYTLDALAGDLRWQQKVGDDFGEFITDVAIDNGLVFATSQPTVVEAYDLVTGERLWSTFDVSMDPRGVRLMPHGDQLYVLGYETYVLDQRTGAIKRTIPQNLRGQWVDNSIFTGDSVIDADTGQRELLLIAPSHRLLHGSCERFNSPYTISDNTIYGVAYCGGVYAIDLANGDMLWEYKPELVGESPTALLDDELYVLFEDGDVHAIDRKTGEPRGVLDTTPPLPGWIIGDPASRGVVTNGKVLIVTFNDSSVLALGNTVP